MARNNEATPLYPIDGSCKPACPSHRPPITPIISVTSVNGECGDVVLRNLIIGDKVYNGSDAVEIFSADLGLEKAFVLKKTLPTKEKVMEAIANAKAGDVYFCNQDGLYYLSVGEGDYKCFISDIVIKDYSKIVDTASRIALEVDADTFQMVARLYDKNGQLVYESEPVDLPAGMKDAIKRGYYDAQTREIVFVLKNDTEIRVPVSGLIDNLQPKITEANKLAFGLVEGLPEFKASIEQNLATEVDARTTAVANEAVTRANADTTEREERITADEALQTAINNEASTRATADSTLTYNLNQEIDQRKYAFDLLKQQIQEEAEERVKVDAKVNKEIVDRTVADTTLQNNINTETSERESADNVLTDAINAEKSTRVAQVIELRNSLANETNARTIRDAELSDMIDDEKSARESNDELLAAQIQKEVQDRTQADDAEKVERVTEDNRIEAKLNKEIADRVQGDADLTTALRNEINAREAADNTLQSNIDAEETARIEADTTLQSNIDTEKGARIEADNNLQEQIKDIPVYGMVKDANPGEYAAVYHLTKKVRDGEVINVGDPINIKKDFLVKSASVKVVVYPDNPYPGAKPGDKYIDFVINSKEAVEPSKEEHIYVPVNDLVDIYTAGAGINISDNNVVSINNETFARLSAVETGLNTEKSLRIAGDTQLADSIETVGEIVTAHIADKNNPHQVTKTQLGLSNVDNTSDINKPVSTAQQTAINTKADEIRAEVAVIRTSLETSISAEATTRLNADNALTSALNTETANRQSEDANLQTKINEEVTNRNTAISAEATLRQSEDTALWNAIRALENKITSVAKEIVCDGVTTEYTVAHNLDTYNVMVQVYENDGIRNQIVVDNTRITANTVKLIFKNAPIANKSYIVMCYGIPMTYSLTFNNNGGSGVMSGVNVVKGVPHIMEACTFTAPLNKTFDKWAIGSVEGVKVAAGEAYTFNNDTTAYATWKSSEPNFYYGTVASIPPTSITGMTSGFITREEVLITPIEKVLPVAEGQKAYEAIAFAKNLNIKVIKVENYEFGQWNDVTEDFASTDTDTMTICYHLNKVTGPTEANYRFTFISK